MKIKLNNNRWMDAESSGDLYKVMLASGRVKYYSVSEIKEIKYDDGETIPVISNESEDVPTPVVIKEGENQMINDYNSLFHYLEELTFADGTKVYRRTITDVLPDEVAPFYYASATSHKVEGNVLHISTGTWRLRLLEEVFVKKNIPFTVHIMEHKQVAEVPDARRRIAKLVENATFSFANATLQTYLTIHVPGATLETMGLTAKHMRKVVKRLQEVTRLSEMNMHLAEEKQGIIKVRTFEPAEGADAKLYDGMNFMNVKTALKAARSIKEPRRRHHVMHAIKTGKLTRMTIRFTNDGFIMKGDCVIVPDDQIDVDLVTFSENLKSEIYTNGFAHLTMWEHHPRHTAVWDYQSSINFGSALPERKELFDLNRVVEQSLAAMQNDEIPSWMLLGEDAHNDDGTVNMEKLSDSLHLNQIAWQAAGLDIRSAQNLTFMGLNGVVKRMTANELISSRITNMSARKKRWIPMTNAVLGAVITYESAVNMGGFTFPNQDPNQVFWDDRVGLVIPGKRFIETYPLHGGWDLDDSVKAIHVRVFAKNDYDHMRGYVIDDRVILPDNEADAIDMLLLVRSPNGPGEYSLEVFNPEGMIDDDMIAPEAIVTFDINNMPSQKQLLANVMEFKGMPTSTLYTKEDLTKAQMLEMILSQMMNPSVGAYCNAIMVYFYCVRAFPDVMLDVMETIVDAAQQGYDLASFEAITKETDSIWNQLVHKCETDPTIRIEAALATAKMPARIQHKVQDRIVKGRFSRMDVAYSKAIATLRNEIALTTLQWRYNSPLVRRLAEKPMDSKYVETCKKLYYKWTFALEAVDAKFKVSEFDHPFAKMVMQQNKQKAFHVIVNEMLEFFNNITDERDRYMLVVNLYKWIVLGQRQDDAKQKLGLRDRIFFQPNAKGEKCLMHILIEGIKYFNLG